MNKKQAYLNATKEIFSNLGYANHCLDISDFKNGFYIIAVKNKIESFNVLKITTNKDDIDRVRFCGVRDGATLLTLKSEHTHLEISDPSAFNAI